MLFLCKFGGGHTAGDDFQREFHEWANKVNSSKLSAKFVEFALFAFKCDFN